MNKTDGLSLVQIVQDREPPATDQLVSYGLGYLKNGESFLHNTNCRHALGDGETIGRTTTGRELLDNFKKDRVVTACSFCYGGWWSHAVAWVYASGGLTGAETVWQGDSALLLYYKMRGMDADKWLHWLRGKTGEQVQQTAKQELGWLGQPHENYVAVFEAAGGPTSWILGVGAHLIVENKDGGGPAIYGLVPEKLVRRLDQDHGKVVVPVDEHFTKEHLAVAVNLYNTGGHLHDERKTAAKNAVTSALLALA